jgi:hypothetical protein
METMAYATIKYDGDFVNADRLRGELWRGEKLTPADQIHARMLGSKQVSREGAKPAKKAKKGKGKRK